MIPELLKALPLTLAITFTAMIAGFLLALIATTFRVRRIPVLSQLADLYVSYARSVPVVLQLFVAFYGLPLVVALFEVEDFVSPNVAAIVGLSLYHGGYLSEVLRPAYLAVERGQHDAADSLGYTFLQKILRVVGPQAVHIALPGYGNSIIYLIHNVALVMYIGAADVMATAHLVMERDYNQYVRDLPCAGGDLFAAMPRGMDGRALFRNAKRKVRAQYRTGQGHHDGKRLIE
jgi:L-cystine transport system permease protein